MQLSTLLEGLVGLLSPACCAGCDLPLRPGESGGPAGGAAALAEVGVGFCGGCAPLLERSPVAERPPAPTASVLRYGGPIADAICRFKYGGRTDLGAALAQPLASAAVAYAGDVDRVIPLPLHPARLRQRGFNQAALLARPVARALGVPLDTRTLQRVRPTRAQAGLAPGARLDNVRAAFSAPGVERLRGGTRVLLIDDVRTTGATLTSAALTLRQAGLSVVATLVLAQAD